MEVYGSVEVFLYQKDLFLQQHIVSIRRAVNATVYLGVHSIAGISRKQKFASSTFIKHPQWSRKTLQNNLAIIKLPQAAVYGEKVFKARLQCTNENLVGKNATVVGWGMESKNVSMALALRHVELEIVDNRKCSDAYRIPILDTQLCQSTPNGKSSCDGDAGGAVVMNDGWGDVLIGIISFGCKVGMPIVHTNIYPYRDWIAAVTAAK
ncbi:chymotrypsin BI-like isoform X2 [Photinus pyralis]|uniref:chymotrypsin BI-like isoform X2 n=1 Tax=Photinus pyralis TaxID=7054 RepID=UPI001267452E|nr:chymotrypsin BI-like isoform X2 [Photinus pyralis]